MLQTRMRTHMKVCALRTKKKIKELEESASNNEEYTWELLQIMEDEESSSSIEVLPHTAEADQDSESDESETYEIVVYTEDFEGQETVRLRNHMSICTQQMEKRLKNLEKSLSNNEEYTREVLLKMEAEETSSSVDVFPQSVVVKQEAEDFEEQ
ncbi:hypothetical protein RP20_CCG021157 [Aedes albopictus]|nr:hypothetical protein RP20_CCG021157 [Aedes albopictus]